MHDPAVAILLATYNGAAHLREQLESYANQSLLPALLLVSDDGSQDDTRQILQDFAVAHPEIAVDVRDGPCQGAAQNFLYLLRYVPGWIEIAALSDQDDVWLADKLRRGEQAIAQAQLAGSPVLYCGRSWECDAELGKRRLSRGGGRSPGFRHALVQNIAGGNTMILNRPALDLVGAASREAQEVVVHDWWIYQVIAGADGQVIFDDVPMLLYRQHGDNLIGANRGLQAKKKRIFMMLSGGVRRWNTINIHALRASQARLTEENRRILEHFATARDRALWHRIIMLWRLGLKRQGMYGTISLYLAALLRKI